jgi:hypothetical protein
MGFLVRLFHRFFLFVVRLLPPAVRRRLFLLPYREVHERLLAPRRAPRQSQEQALLRIVEANRRTEFGRAHAFDQIHNVESFLARVPLRTYAEFEPYLQRQRRGESGVVLAEPLVGFAMSGGSRGRPRAIPVSERSLDHWAVAEDLLAREAIRHQPDVALGVALQILPTHSLQMSRTALPLLPLPVLATLAGRAPRLRAALPAALFSVGDEVIRYYLILRLALTQRVAILRAASPGTLAILASHLELLGHQLVEDLGSGQVAHLAELPDEVRQVIPAQRPERLLATRLQERMARHGRLEPRDIWPDLSILVCSSTGPSRAAAERLPDRFGGVSILDPGYRVAEGVVTLPWVEGPAGALALGSGFFEFLPAGTSGPAVLPETLVVGQKVQPVVTGSNGLYRYVLDDVLEVVEISTGVPHLALLGRAKRHLRLEAGMVPEEEFGEALAAACRSHDVTVTSFTAWVGQLEERASTSDVVAPAKEGWLARLRRNRSAESPSVSAPSLVLALESGRAMDHPLAKQLAGALDHELHERSRVYAAARSTGKLGRVELLLLKAGTFARRGHRRLADGAADAHAPQPMFCDDPWETEPAEVEFRV